MKNRKNFLRLMKLKYKRNGEERVMYYSPEEDKIVQDITIDKAKENATYNLRMKLLDKLKQLKTAHRELDKINDEILSYKRRGYAPGEDLRRKYLKVLKRVIDLEEEVMYLEDLIEIRGNILV